MFWFVLTIADFEETEHRRAAIPLRDISLNLKRQKHMFNLISSSISAAQPLTNVTLSDHLDALVADRSGWENEEFLRSNERLYSILFGCYQAGWNMNGVTEEHKAMKASFKAYCDVHDLNFNNSTHTMVRIVRLVFGNADRRRISAYGTALKNLLIDGVTPAAFVDTIKAAGGIEEVRRAGTASKNKSADRTDMDRAALTGPVLGSVSGIDLSSQFDASANCDAVILIATPEADGSFAIRRLVQKKSVVKTALASIAKAVAEEQKKAKELADRQNTDEQREQAIKDALREAA